MNDFTKEELEDLIYCVRQMDIHIDNYDEIKNKLKSLIDNYCNCTEIKTLKDIDGVEIVDYCASCGKPI